MRLSESFTSYLLFCCGPKRSGTGLSAGPVKEVLGSVIPAERIFMALFLRVSWPSQLLLHSPVQINIK